MTAADVTKAVDKALADTGLTARADAYPPNLNRGEKQRVAIASALAMHTKYIILDEPTSGQDTEEKVRLMKLLTSSTVKALRCSSSRMTWTYWDSTASGRSSSASYGGIRRDASGIIHQAR
jgi:ABC-type polar amino acid transport system ATPase subunit